MVINDRPIRILHISDLHIGESEGENKHLLLMPGAEPKVLSDIIKRVVEEHGDPFTADFIVVTGDLISQTAKRDVRQACYKSAKEQLDVLWQAMGIRDKSHVLVTPGNHDVLSPKTDKDADDCTRLNDYLEFVHLFYEDIPDERNPSLLSIKRSKDGVEVHQGCIPYEEGVVFWPLVTCHLTDHDKNQDGVCSKLQISKGESSLQQIPHIADMCCIAIAHHNFLPAIDTPIKPNRRGVSRGSMEALKFFFKYGVKIILHGHRHQDYVLSFGEWEESGGSAYRNERLIVGAPSIGFYRNKSADKNNKEKEKREEDGNSEHDLAGFATLELHHNVESTNVTLKKYRLLQQGNGEWFANPPDVRIRTLRRREGLQEFMTFSEGYREFASEILNAYQSDKRIRSIILHYHDDTEWHNAFNRFWRLDIADDAKIDLINKDLNMWLEPIGPSLLGDGYLGEDLKEAIRRTKLDSKVMQIVAGKITERDIVAHPFLLHLYHTANRDTEGARIITYIAEAIYCATNPNVDFRKHVYLSPVEGKHMETKSKFIWLLESIMLARELKNFSMSWLPFSIAGYQGKSLVGIHDQHEEGHYEDTFYVGFDPETEPHRNSVLRLPRYIDRNSAEGPILDDLKALMRKVINPLSQRLVHDFPIFTNGDINSSNLCCIALAMGVEEIWEEEVGRRFKSAFGIRPKSCRIKKCFIRRLDSLYDWVAGNSRNNDWIPWVQEDKDKIMQSLEDRA